MKRRTFPSGSIVCGMLGVTILLASLAIAGLAPQLQYETPPEQRPVVLFVSLYAAAGAAWLAALPLLRHLPTTLGPLLLIVTLGLLMRLVMLGAGPILENDYHRYLWDGSVTAAGQTPYRLPPEEAAPNAPAAADTLARINHAQYTTIYPPVAQTAFAAAHFLRPFSVTAWRAIILLCELATLGLLLLLLSRLNLPPTFAALYWCCPLVIVELTQRAHMDALLAPLLIGALLAAHARRPLITGGLLGLAAGVKLWPLVLAPLLLPPLPRRERGQVRGSQKAVHTVGEVQPPPHPASPRRGRGAIGGIGLALVIAAIMTAPLLLGPASLDTAGLLGFASHWHNNSALYMLLGWLLQPIAWITPLAAEHAHYLARPMLAITYLLGLAWLIRSPAATLRHNILRAFAAIAGLFLLSPAQFPWYFAWLLAPAAVAWPLVPRQYLPLLAALLLYVVTLPMYYLTYDHPAFVFAVHLPPTLAILLTLLWPKLSTDRPSPRRLTTSASSSPP